MKSGRLARLCALVMATPACAQDAPDELVVTASRTAGLVALGGVALDAAALARAGEPTVIDALDRLPGVRAFAKGGVAGGTYLSVRGGEPNFTQVLLEGVKLNDPTNSAGGAFDLAQLDPALIDRVEMFAGAASAVHGADALAGVVNMRLAPPVAGMGGAARASSEGELGLAARAGLPWAGGGLTLGGGLYDSGDLDSAGHLSRQQALVRATATPAGLKLAVLGLYAQTKRRAFPEDGGGPRLSVLRDPETRDTRLAIAGVEIARATGSLRPGVRASFSRARNRADTPAIAPGILDGVPAIAADTVFDRFEVVGELRFERGPIAAAAGAAWLDEQGRGNGAVDFGVVIPADFALGRTLASGFAEATLTPARWASLTAGVRHDSPSSTAAETTARARLALQPWEAGPTLSASWAEGFKLPSLFALAYPLIANPNLKPERGEAIEIAAAWGPVRLALFQTRYRDLIDFDPERFTNVNRARVRVRGLEAGARARLSTAFALTGQATLIDTSNFDGPPLRSRPRWRASADAEWAVTPSLTLTAGAAYVDRRFELSVPSGQIALPARAVVDLGARYRISPRWRIEAVARNLFDASYEEQIGFPAPGRVLRMALVLTPAP